MKTLIFVHGGESFNTDTEYERFLRTVYSDWQSKSWSPSEEKFSWKDVIAKKWYFQGNQVFMPVFPNKLNARYEDWKIVFEGIISKLSREDEVSIVGTSLGGCFLLKYFSEQNHKNHPFVISGEVEQSIPRSYYENEENTFLKVQEKGMPTAGQKRIQIQEIHLVAACIECGNFLPPSSYEFLQQFENQVHIWHSEDDSVVPFSVGEEISKNLPKAETHFFSSEKGYGHFHGAERIQELEEVIFGQMK